MKSFIIALFLIGGLLCGPAVVWAGPFLVCDSYPSTVIQPDEFEVVMDGGAVVYSPAQTVSDGVRIHYDVGGVSTGSHTVGVKACLTDDAWGRLCSTAVNFTFVRPSEPAVPANMRLSQ